VHTGSRLDINEVRIDNTTDWSIKNWNSLTFNYGKASYFRDYVYFFENVYRRKWEWLLELDLVLIEDIMGILGIEVPIRMSSSLGADGKSTELLINICKAVGADTYLSGAGGRNYMDMRRFHENGIRVIFQEFQHPVYPQCFQKVGFQANMSIIDLVFNCGQKSLEVIKSGAQ